MTKGNATPARAHQALVKAGWVDEVLALILADMDFEMGIEFWKRTLGPWGWSSGRNSWMRPGVDGKPPPVTVFLHKYTTQDGEERHTWRYQINADIPEGNSNHGIGDTPEAAMTRADWALRRYGYHLIGGVPDTNPEGGG